MGFFGMSMLGRAGIGATTGGIMGGLSDRGSVLGGALGGAAMGAAMTPGNIGKLKGALGSPGSLMARGAGALGGLSTRLMNKGYGMLGKGAMSSNLGAGMAYAGQIGRRGTGAIQNLIGGNMVSINKYGSGALAAAGIASGAMIGSTVLGSNRGY